MKSQVGANLYARMTKAHLVQWLQYHKVPAVQGLSVEKAVRLYPKDLLVKWANEVDQGILGE